MPVFVTRLKAGNLLNILGWYEIHSPLEMVAGVIRRGRSPVGPGYS